MGGLFVVLLWPLACAPRPRHWAKHAHVPTHARQQQRQQEQQQRTTPTDDRPIADSLFSACLPAWLRRYLSVPPVIRGHLRSSFPDTFDSDDKARVPSSLLGAFTVCYLSHPFDTAKTCMQGDVERKKYGSLRATFSTLCVRAASYRRVFCS